MRISGRNGLCCLILLLGATSTLVFAADGAGFPADGWVRWEVATVDDAPRWCCFSWEGKRSTPAVCDLDGPDHGFGSRSEDDSVSQMRVYAQFAQGKVERVRTLAADCPVQTRDPIAVATMTGQQSVDWLVARVTPRSALSSDALAALAVHRGAVAGAAIAAIARHAEHIENRKEAMFWATQVRADEGLQLVLPMLNGDADARIREQAAFAVAQTKAPTAIKALLLQAKSDASHSVRSHAWFWLAETGAAQIEAEIAAALRKEKSSAVREQAIFALSQLPEPRNVHALIATAKDQGLTREDRKQAIFWLGQSESTDAVRYLDGVLDGTAAL